MVLLDVLHRLSVRHRWKLSVAHLDHQLRGSSSAADARFVAGAAAAMGLPFVSEQADVRGLAKSGDLSLEMAARQARHFFLARTARKVAARTIAVAHHADDQLELFFLRLLRGAGPEGLAGMRWRGKSPVDARLWLVRPLLDCSKTDLEGYAKEQGITWRKDASNCSLDIPRNRIRHELLPLLRRRYQPGLDRVIARLMELLRAEGDFTQATASGWLSSLNKEPFGNLPVAVQRECLRMQLLDLGVAADFDLVEKLRLAPGVPIQSSRSGNRAKGSPGQKEPTTLIRDHSGRVGCELRRKAFTGFISAEKTIELGGKPRGQIRFGGRLIRYSCAGDLGIREQRAGIQKAGQLKPGANQRNIMSSSELFDADRVGTTVILRHWRPGDHYQPIGMANEVKLQDCFTNQKVSREQRHKLLIATTSQGEIFWVEGLRISERFKLTSRTNRGLQWAWKRL